MKQQIIIRVFSHGLSIKTSDYRVRTVLESFRETVAQWDFRKVPPSYKMKRVMVRSYSGRTNNRMDYRFHRNQLNELLKHFDHNGIPRSSVEIVKIKMYEPIKVEMNLELFEPFDYQVPLIDFCSTTEQVTQAIHLQAGRGKTQAALHIAKRGATRTMILLRGGYVSRWAPEIIKALNTKPKSGELLIIQGGKDLKRVIEAAKAGLISENLKFVIITNKTVFQLIEAYENSYDKNEYGIEPQQLYRLLGIGRVIVDEVHEDFHLVMRATLYSHVPYHTVLSATLDTEDRLRKLLYSIMFPPETFAPMVAYKAYIEVRAVHYRLKQPKLFHTTRKGQNKYSHSAFEESLIRNRTAFDGYMKIIFERLGVNYLEPYQGGQKALVFCSLTSFVEAVTTRLREVYTDLVINSFYSGIPDSVLEKSDIIVTTIESCGTARDIPDLSYTLLTRAVRKLEANEQIKGRLRELKRYPGRYPRFDYLVCDDIPKHVEYHNEKKNQFKGKALFHIDEFIRQPI